MSDKKPRHLLFIGTVGAGKSFHAKLMKDKLGMFVFNIDLFRFVDTPKDLLDQIEKLKTDRLNAYNVNDIDVVIERKQYLLKMREMAPHAHNLYELGYDEEFAKKMYEKFGTKDGQKLFILYSQMYLNKMTNEIIKDLKEPCIIDASGGQYMNYNFSREIMLIAKRYFEENRLPYDEKNIPDELVRILKLSKDKDIIAETEKSRSSLNSIGPIVFFKQNPNIFKGDNKASNTASNKMMFQEKYLNDLKSFKPLTIDTTNIFVNSSPLLHQKEIKQNLDKIARFYKSK